MKELHEQIHDTVLNYIEHTVPTHESSEHRQQIAAALISGMSLAARFISMNDGHPEATSQNLEKATAQVAIGMGLQLDQLKGN